MDNIFDAVYAAVTEAQAMQQAVAVNADRMSTEARTARLQHPHWEMETEMTTDKLPDVVYVRFSAHGDPMWVGTAPYPYGPNSEYVPRYTLDTMTAERDRQYDAAVEFIAKIAAIEKERDSAREALAKATKLLRDVHPDNYRVGCEICAFLAAQKPFSPEVARALGGDRSAYFDSAAQPETKT